MGYSLKNMIPRANEVSIPAGWHLKRCIEKKSRSHPCGFFCGLFVREDYQTERPPCTRIIHDISARCPFKKDMFTQKISR